MSRPRFPRRLYARGSEPDARVSLANERTFLAWITSGLGLLSAGVALESFALALHPTFRLAAALTLIGGGMVCAVMGWLRWMRVEQALREGRPLPSTGAMAVLASVLAVACLLVVGGLLAA